MFNLLKRTEEPSTEIEIQEDDFRPMSELEHFTSKTRTMLAGLDVRIETLDREINEMIARLGDLRRIRSAQELALRHMEGEL